MLVSTYHLTDVERTRARRVWIDARPFVIGSAPSCDVVIDDPEVAPQHLRVSAGPDGQILVENLGPTADLDGTPTAPQAALPIGEGRPVRIGGTIVKLRMQQQSVVTTGRASTPDIAPPMPANPPRPANPPAPPRPVPRPRPFLEVLSSDPTEQHLIAQLRAKPQDSEARLVYGDWLEERGLNAKAQIVKLREHLDTFMHVQATKLEWRVICARTPIEHCIQNKCPQSWDALVAMPGQDFTRNCERCQRVVRYCADKTDVRTAAWDQGPVVFDAALDRVAAHAWYSTPAASWRDDEEDDLEDDPEGYTVDSPLSPYRR
jgi:uncharacterized protein (TIGR02996 family)